MKAALLEKFGSPLVVKTLPDPVPGTGEVIVKISSAPVLSYANEVFSGERNYLLNLPIVPGCGAIWQVHSIGPDATKLKAGDWVFCDPTVRSRDNALNPDITLQGWSARGEGGLKLQQYFHDGPFAGQIMVPTENAIPIGNIDPSDASKWCALNTLLIPYGGLLAANLVAGETILISGATGNFGSAAVAVALAMGAACVVAPGRNEKVLEDLKKRFGNRIRTVKLTGHEDEDKKAMIEAAAGPIDCVFDMLPPSAGIAPVRAAVLTVRPYGRIVLMGGVGMQDGAELNLPYAWIMRNCVTMIGQWMYPPKATTLMAGMIRSGVLDLDQFNITEFDLNDVNDAVQHAAMNGGPFKLTIIKP